MIKLIYRSQLSIVKNFETMSVVSTDESLGNISKAVNTMTDCHVDNDDEHNDNIFYPSFGTYKGVELRPKFVKFTKVFPTYPPTHPEGYATVVELENNVLIKLFSLSKEVVSIRSQRKDKVIDSNLLNFLSVLRIPLGRYVIATGNVLVSKPVSFWLRN